MTSAKFSKSSTISKLVLFAPVTVFIHLLSVTLIRNCQAFTSLTIIENINQFEWSLLPVSSPWRSRTITPALKEEDGSDSVDVLIVDDFADGDEQTSTYIPPDMRYVPRNVKRQHDHFKAIRMAGGKENIRDVYVRKSSSFQSNSSTMSMATDYDRTFWFVGKVACVSDLSMEHCIARQWSLIETHAVNLRPLDLFSARGTMEIWSAPGDSELDVAYNRPDLIFERHARPSDDESRELMRKIKNILFGFEGEMYDRGEEGFRTLRNEDGTPARPEIKGPNDTPVLEEESNNDAVTESFRAPNEEEFKQLQEMLDDKDINELYEEQQRRKG